MGRGFLVTIRTNIKYIPTFNAFGSAYFTSAYSWYYVMHWLLNHIHIFTCIYVYIRRNKRDSIEKSSEPKREIHYNSNKAREIAGLWEKFYI